MKRTSLIRGCVCVCFLFVLRLAEGDAQQPKQIPLDQIWGYNLPGTRDIAGIALPEKQGFGQSLEYLRKQRDHNIEQLRRALTAKHPTEEALHGFVLNRPADFHTLQGVSNILRGSLRNPPKVVGVIGDTLPRRDAFIAGEEMTLIFFSHPSSYYLRLRNVHQKDDHITVQYQFEPHNTPEVTVHFALIPLGKLPAGEYHVRFEQLPLDKKYREAGFEPIEPDAPTMVSRNFSFNVIEPLKEEPPIEGATSIPLSEIWAYEIPGTREVSRLHPSLVQTLTRKIADKFKRNDPAGAAFVVEGTGKVALENMADAFNDEPSRYAPVNKPISLVFYSRLSSHYIHLERVERIANRIVVTYRFATHATYNMSFHFALIPLGELPAGTYEVEIRQLPPIDEFGRPATLNQDVSRIVCRRTTFYVGDLP